MTTVRAKFRCSDVTLSTFEPVELKRYGHSPTEDATTYTWPRRYTFSAIYDTSTPENRRFSQATPYGKIEMTVDNPEVNFVPGKVYYLDFTEAPDA